MNVAVSGLPAVGGGGWVVLVADVPVLLRAEGGAAAPVAVDLLHGGADIIVAHVQHVEAGRRRRGQQGGAVEQRQAALRQSRLHTHITLLKKNPETLSKTKIYYFLHRKK